MVNYKVQGRIGIVTLNRPESMNAFNLDMYRSFNEALRRFRENEEVWVCVIHANGEKAFSAGVDINALPTDLENASAAEKAAILEQFSIELEEEYFCDKPIIAAIHGYCIGEGLSMALGCDLRIADTTAKFCLPEAKIGIPTVNAAMHGASKIGISNILELLLLGEQRDADWAYRTGLVNKVVPAGKALEAALEWAEKIASLSPLAIQITKEVAVRSRYRTFDEGVAIADPKKDAVLNSSDYKEAVQAFLEKRKPIFTGR